MAKRTCALVKLLANVKCDFDKRVFVHTGKTVDVQFENWDEFLGRFPEQEDAIAIQKETSVIDSETVIWEATVAPYTEDLFIVLMTHLD